MIPPPTTQWLITLLLLDGQWLQKIQIERKKKSEEKEKEGKIRAMLKATAIRAEGVAPVEFAMEIKSGDVKVWCSCAHHTTFLH